MSSAYSGQSHYRGARSPPSREYAPRGGGSARSCESEGAGKLTVARVTAQAMQEYYRPPPSPRPAGANSGAGNGGAAGRGAPHAATSSAGSYATVRPLPTPQGWGGQGVTSPTLGSAGFAAGQQRGYSSGLEERRTSGSGQATDWSGGGYPGYRRDGHTVSFLQRCPAIARARTIRS